MPYLARGLLFTDDSNIMTKAPRRRTQAERTQASDRAIFRAAIKLLASEGPSRMTMAKLGKEAGFTGGLVSYRFGSKSNLVKATAELILDKWSKGLVIPLLQSEPGLKGLEKVTKHYLGEVAARSDLVVAQFRLMNESFSTYSELQAAFQDYDDRTRQLIVDLLQPAQQEGVIRADADLETFSVIYIGALRGIATQFFVHSKAIDTEAAFEMLQEIFKKFLLP